MRSPNIRRTIAALSVCGVLVASCGSDATSDDTSSSTDAETTEATQAESTETETETEPSDGDGDGAMAEGEPVKVIVMGAIESQVLSIPQIVDGVNTGAGDVNATGGIAGHPVEVIECNTMADPNEAANCAREAVDEGVIAAVGTLSIMADAIVPILEEAGIAMVGTSAITPLETVSPIAFPTAGGIYVTYTGIAQMLNEQAGAETIGLIHLDSDSGRRSAGFVQQGIEDLGLTLGNVVTIPDGAADVAPQVAAAVEGADAIAVVLAPQDAAKVFSVIAGQDLDIAVGVNDGGLPAALVSALGAAVEGVYIASSAPPPTSLDAPGIQQYVDAAAAAGVEPDGLASDRWLAMKVLQSAMEGAETVDAATVLERMGQIDCLSLAWLDCYTTTSEADIEGFTRIFNFNAYFSQVQDGTMTYVDGPVAIGG